MSQAEKQVEEQVEKVDVEEPLVLNSTEILQSTEEIADSMSITDFTAPRSNINHGHDTDKHDVRDRFGVRDEFVSEHFSDYGIAPNDHAALWLMSYKEEEFKSADTKVFRDTHDGDDSRWQKIKSYRGDAPIPPKVQQNLK